VNVIDAYADLGYIHFVLDTGETKRFPTYWALSMWSGAESHEGLQALLAATPVKTYPCTGLGCEGTIVTRFRSLEPVLCVRCMVMADIDRDIFAHLPEKRSDE
jgi:hypothetical protein